MEDTQQNASAPVPPQAPEPVAPAAPAEAHAGIGLGVGIGVLVLVGVLVVAAMYIFGAAPAGIDEDVTIMKKPVESQQKPSAPAPASDEITAIEKDQQALDSELSGMEKDLDDLDAALAE